MNRNDFQRLAEIRAREALLLFDNGCFDGAYYLAGYAIECALKAAIAKRTREHDFPDRQTVNASHTHNLADLVRVAELKLPAVGSVLEANWAVVKEWTEQSRYETKTRREAADILEAITAEADGVLRWLRQHW